MRAAAKDEDYDPDMPPVDVGGHLIGYLFEIGPAAPGAAGAVTISHQEIVAWQTLTGVRLQSWEARFIKRLSAEYVTELHKAEKPSRMSPWQSTDSAPSRADVAKALQAAIDD